jgi:hypothetical protein
MANGNSTVDANTWQHVEDLLKAWQKSTFAQTCFSTNITAGLSIIRYTQEVGGGQGMARGRQTSSEQATETVRRTTLVLPAALDQNLEMLCAMRGVAKGEVIKTVLSEFLSKQSLQPDKSPKNISIVY